MSHIAIFGRRRGNPRISKPELRRCAATIAAGGLQQMWERMVAECGIGHIATADVNGADGSRVHHGSVVNPDLVHDPELRPLRRLTPAEEMLLAQHHVNNGDPARAIGVFGASPVGNGLDPSVQKALLGLTAFAGMPTAEVMADTPARVSPLQLNPLIVDSVIGKLPTGRASGTLLTSYELIRGTHARGARTGWVRFLTSFAAGKLTYGLCLRSHASSLAPFGAFAGSHCLPMGYFILWDFGSVLWDACGLLELVSWVRSTCWTADQNAHSCKLLAATHVRRC